MGKRNYLWLSIILITFPVIAPGRSAPNAAQSSELMPTNCEYNISILTGAHRQAGDDGLIIMIARLGNSERDRELNRRRLHNARTFLTEFGNRSLNTIVTAEGEGASGYGRVEFYVGGKLFSILAVARNDDLSVGACSFEGADPCTFERERKLYPCLDRKPRARKR
jgi:hypothetical protein